MLPLKNERNDHSAFQQSKRNRENKTCFARQYLAVFVCFIVRLRAVGHLTFGSPKRRVLGANDPPEDGTHFGRKFDDGGREREESMAASQKWFARPGASISGHNESSITLNHQPMASLSLSLPLMS